MTHPGEKLLRRHIEEVWSRGEVALLDQIFHHDTRNHLAPGGLPAGREGIRVLVSGMRRIVPDLILDADAIEVAGDLVFVRGVFTGTHTGGDYYGIAPTGRRLRWNVIGLFRYQDGKFAEEWAISDELENLRRISTGNPAATLRPQTFPTRGNSILDDTH